MPSADPRGLWFGVGMGALFVGAAFTQARVQVFERDPILKLAQASNRYVVGRPELAHRGAIVSADGKVLAQSEDSFVLQVNFKRAPRSPAFLLELAAASGIPASEFEGAARGGGSRTWRRDLTADQARQIQAVKVSWRADGVSLDRTLEREYPFAEVTAGLVGAVRDGKPTTGLEFGCDALLEGEDGYRTGVVDRSGAFLKLEGRSIPRRNGQSLTLTIDTRLQIAAHYAIRQAVEAHEASSGVAIVIDPKTGDLLAMANWPTFDPTGQGGAGKKATDFNPAVMGFYEPGSTFKILTLAEALQSGKVSMGDSIYCSGTLKINRGSEIHCDRKHGAHGAANLERAIAKSCNVSAATWALRVGNAGMVRFVDDLELLRRPKLGLRSEVRGRFRRDDPAKALQTATLGFGQSINVTPVMLASAFAMIGNEGIWHAPRLVREIGGTEPPRDPGRRILDAGVANDVLKLMASVIQSDEGTGAKLRVPGYRLAGKTGTAQKTNRVTGTMKGGGYVASFVGFVPAEKPQAMILVMVDNPRGSAFYGSQVAGPVFRELAGAVIRTYRIPPSSRAAP
ncbi:MAG TPA: penicillin-binding protein 2 [Fimbriimonadaceae bacterium]|nr:penicillin-binding protein 2 [Fimbriimonadaceae bacterium]